MNAYQWTLPATPIHPAGARHFRNWLLGPGQSVIARYGMDELGEALFIPTGMPLDTLSPAGSDPATGDGPAMNDPEPGAGATVGVI